MDRVRIRVLGCGDAFGSGGRLQSCYLVTSEAGACLLDCGATALVAMRRFAIDPERIDTIFLSHLHGDHFAGVLFLLLEQHFIARREQPLLIAGPVGTEGRVMAALDLFFPGAAQLAWRFPLRFAELSPRRTAHFGDFAITPHVVAHPSGSPAFAFRLETRDRMIAYSGDTAWTDTLVEVACGADVFIVECYAYDGSAKHHMDYLTLRRNLAKLHSKRLLLTHLGREMLERLPEVDLEVAVDGQVLEL
jgi:ribonuclease BN (tRNA processing enzyme)